jgi:hypothetical protein
MIGRFEVGNLQLQWHPRKRQIENYAPFPKSLCGRCGYRTYVVDGFVMSGRRPLIKGNFCVLR